VALVNPYQQYRQAQVATVNQAKLVVMLYDGAVNFLSQALAAGNVGQQEEMRRLLGRAQDIVFELWATLDLETGEIAGNLYRLYEYINGRLVAAAISRETAPLEEAAGLLSGLREAWLTVSDETSAMKGDGTLG
jgi:flagellar protein FliS